MLSSNGSMIPSRKRNPQPRRRAIVPRQLEIWPEKEPAEDRMWGRIPREEQAILIDTLVRLIMQTVQLETSTVVREDNHEQ